ncbi:MAG: hypothetical protein ACW980_21250 [Promethearchaeota archaeon]
MKIKIIIITSILLVSGLGPLANLLPNEVNGSGISLSYPTLKFFNVKAPGNFSNSNFYFDVTHVGDSSDTPINIIASAEVLGVDNWRELFIITFDQNNITTDPNEKIKFFPTIQLFANISYAYKFHFIFTGINYNVTGNTILSSIGATVLLEVNSNREGVLFHLKTTDQGNQERKSKVTMQYSETDQGYSGFDSFEDSFYAKVIPFGYYFIQATDLETEITESKYIFLSKDNLTETSNKIEYNIVYEIITILWNAIAPGRSTDNFLINYTIINQYQRLSSVKMVLSIYSGEMISSNLIDSDERLIEDFTKGSYSGSFNVSGYKWKTGQYYILGNLYEKETLYFSKYQSVYLTMPLFEELENSGIFELIPYFLSIGLGMLIVYSYPKVVRKIKEKRKKVDETVNT